MSTKILFGALLLTAIPFFAVADGAVPRARDLAAPKSLLMKRLGNAYKATGLRGRQLQVLAAAAHPTSLRLGPALVNRVHLTSVPGLDPVPERIDTVIVHAADGTPLRSGTRAAHWGDVLDVVRAQKARLEPLFSAHATRTAALEAQLMRRMDEDFAATRPQWTALVAEGTTPRLVQTAAAIVDALPGMASGRSIRQLETVDSTSTSKVRGESTAWNVFGDLKAHAVLSHDEASNLSGRSLVVGASTYRIDLVERKHLGALGALSRAQRLTPEARILVERVVQATELVRELQRRDVRDGTHHAAPFARWIEESTLEVSPPMLADLGAPGSARIYGPAPAAQPGETLHLGRIKEDLIERQGRFDFISAGMVRTLRDEIGAERAAFIDRVPGM